MRPTCTDAKTHVRGHIQTMSSGLNQNPKGHQVRPCARYTQILGSVLTQVPSCSKHPSVGFVCVSNKINKQNKLLDPSVLFFWLLLRLFITVLWMNHTACREGTEQDSCTAGASLPSVFSLISMCSNGVERMTCSSSPSLLR